MNCGHPTGTHEGHSRAGINRRVGGAGAPAVGVEGGHMASEASRDSGLIDVAVSVELY